MQTLKELRTQLGLNQSDVASKIGISAPLYSNYENNHATPLVEDMINMERQFSQRIKWEDNISKTDRKEIMNCIMILSENYPLSAVLNFAQKWIKQDMKDGNPSRGIKHFTKASGLIQEPLLPTGVK